MTDKFKVIEDALDHMRKYDLSFTDNELSRQALTALRELQAQPLPAGLERCEFDDECDYCNSPEQGSYTRLTHNAEDCTEAEFYICGACLAGAIPPKTAQQATSAEGEATRTVMDVTIEDYALKLLHTMVAPALEDDDECSPVRLLLGDGHSGYGLYIASADYPEEGAELLATVKEPASKPAQQAQKPLGWYCVDKTGMATLCADEEDAKQSAKLAAEDWPRHAPYIATQLYTAPSRELVQQARDALADQRAGVTSLMQIEDAISACDKWLSIQG